jgi:hypothetical protein
MLWSQFSAIFHNFWRKNWRFSEIPMLWSNYFKIWLCFESKTPVFFAKFFGENILTIITSVPDLAIFRHSLSRFFTFGA